MEYSKSDFENHLKVCFMLKLILNWSLFGRLYSVFFLKVLKCTNYRIYLLYSKRYIFFPFSEIYFHKMYINIYKVIVCEEFRLQHVLSSVNFSAVEHLLRQFNDISINCSWMIFNVKSKFYQLFRDIYFIEKYVQYF